ncbi:MAG: hypothetical protein GC193_07295 [Cryomorphaceae bacterium]|nr:hypothetical protein [Cryomorphaceae bacterium]
MPIRLSADDKNKAVPDLSRVEYMNGVSNFQRLFREKVSNQPMGSKILVPWDIFKAHVIQRLKDLHISSEKAVIAFFIGLDADLKVKTGLSVFGVENDIVEGVDNNILIPSNGQRIEPQFEFEEISTMVNYNGASERTHAISASTSPWKYASDYFSIVQRHRAPINPATPNFQDVHPHEDARIVLFPWEKEVVALERANPLIGKRPYLIISDYTSFVINGATRVRVNGANGYYHSKAMHIGGLDNLNSLTDELNVGSAVVLTYFQGRAIDYGNLCPPLCDHVRF